MLHYDTDSVIYKWALGLTDIPTGKFVREMTDETGGDPIMEVSTAGPEFFCYETEQVTHECKQKGIKQTDEIMEKLNFASMRDHVLLELDNPQKARTTMTIDIKNHFVRNKKTKNIHLEDIVKTFGVV